MFSFGIRLLDAPALFGLSLVWLILGSLPSASAGGGPENVFLIVNQSSVPSKTVANHYIDLRHIPSQNVYRIEFPINRVGIGGTAYKMRFLKPILDEIKKRNLTNQIDYIVWSADFPWRVNYTKEFGDPNTPRHMLPIVSLTGATYYAAFVQQDRKEMLSPMANFYCTPVGEEIVVSHGFRSTYRWTRGGKKGGADGLPYILSAMLGVTSVPGNTVDEISWYLKRSAAADGTRPPGTIYYAKNNTIRSTVRDQDFRKGMRMVQMAGVRAEIVEGFFPQFRQDIMGVSCGHSVVDPKGAKVGFRPGAFCDNFTSAGGQFVPGKGQTYISEFMSLGAAGASGTVAEPMAVAAKFPNATLFGHYARGCSLAEAFYQSVAGPYQQLLIGDPLCQPWAKIPEVALKGLEDRSFFEGTVELTPTATKAQIGIARFQLFIDGQLKQECRAGGKFKLDTTQLGDGYHELRVVATDKTPIETQGRLIKEIMVKNSTDAVQLSVEKDSLTRGKTDIILKAVSTTPQPITVLCNGLTVSEGQASNEEILVSKEKVGFGPLTFTAICGEETPVRSRPLRIDLLH